MELRLVVLTCLAATAAGAAPVRQVPLDDHVSHEVRIGTEAPTTIVFPGPITALDGANVSAKGDAPVILSHQPGTSYLAVRANRAAATGGLNVILRGKAYALTFRTEENPDRVITFVERTETQAAPGASTAVTMLGLLDRAKHVDSLVAQYPGVAAQMERIACPERTGAVRLQQGFRFPAERALVLQWRVENRGKEKIRYVAGDLHVHDGRHHSVCGLTDGSGVIPAGTAEIFWIVVPEAEGGDLKPEMLQLGGIEAR